MNPTIEKCKLILERHYGTRFVGLVLYGSMASDSARPGSDIDLLVLLSGAFDYFSEVRVITDILYPAQLESERLVSAKPVAVEDYEKGSLQLYRNAKKEAVIV